MHGISPVIDGNFHPYPYSSMPMPPFNVSGPTPGLDIENEQLSAKEKLKLRNKEHARNTRFRRKQRIDMMKATLMQLKGENDILVGKIENKETANMLLSILDPSKMNAQRDYLESLKTSDSLVTDIIMSANREAQKQIELNSLKLKAISHKSKGGNSNSINNNSGDDDSSANPEAGDERSSEENSHSDDIINNRKQRNRIHSMNTRERRKRFYDELENSIEILKYKNIKLTEALYSNSLDAATSSVASSAAVESPFILSMAATSSLTSDASFFPAPPPLKPRPSAIASSAGATEHQQPTGSRLVEGNSQHL